VARRVYRDNYNVPVHETDVTVNIHVSFTDWYLRNYILQNVVET